MLVVEDLDRIDPAHLFRILNVFSAHIDYCYKYGNKAEDSIAGNKFGLDNIVLVCDFSNIRKLFRHFMEVVQILKGTLVNFCLAHLILTLFTRNEISIYTKTSACHRMPVTCIEKYNYRRLF